MADVCVLQRLAAGVQRGDRKLDPAAVDLCHERLLVEIAKVLLADFLQRDQDVAEDAIEQFDGGRFGRRMQAKRILCSVTHGLVEPPCVVVVPGGSRRSGSGVWSARADVRALREARRCAPRVCAWQRSGGRTP